MKKQLEAELVSLAHRILQLKNREDIEVLYKEAQKLYETLAVLRFAEEHLQDPQPTIGLTEVYTAVEAAATTSEDTVVEEIAETSTQENSEEETPIEEELVEESSTEEEIEAAVDIEVGAEETEAIEEDEDEIAKEDEIAEEPENTIQEEVTKEEATSESTDNQATEIEELIAPVWEAFTAADKSLAEEKADLDQEATTIDLSVGQPIIHTLDADFFVPVATEATAQQERTIDADLETVEDVQAEEQQSPQAAAIDALFNAFEPKITVESPATEKPFLTFDFEPEAQTQAVESSPSEPVAPVFEIETPTVASTTKSTNYFDLATPIARPGLDNELRTTLNERLSKGITIGLNDRIAYIKHLFNGSSEDYNRVLSQLMTLDTLAEANDFIEQMVKPDYNNWAGKSEFEARFMENVEKRFL